MENEKRKRSKPSHCKNGLGKSAKGYCHGWKLQGIRNLPSKCKYGKTAKLFCRKKPKSPKEKICAFGRTVSRVCRARPCKHGMNADESCVVKKAISL